MIAAIDTPLTKQQKLSLAARRDFTIFKRVIWKRYEVADHLDLLDYYLMEVEKYIRTEGKEGIGRLIVEFPPRHGKSQSISRLFPAWFRGKNPDKHIILACYGASLAKGHSRFVRAIIKTENFNKVFPDVKLAPDAKAWDQWQVADPYEGVFNAVGRDGSATGKGAHLLIVDDPIKTAKEARSPLLRESVWEWFTTDLDSRIEPGGAIICVMTRWHYDDLHGRLRTRQDGKWTILKLPAIAEENDQMKRKPGSALWPKRFPVSELNEKKSKNAYAFAALYQQNPQPSEGGLFKRANFKIIKTLPSNIRLWCMYWDLALSEKESADKTAGLLLGETYDKEYVIGYAASIKKEWDEVPDFIEDEMLKIGPMFHNAPVEYGIESVYISGRAVGNLLKRPKLHDFTIRGINVTTDKYYRATPVASRVGEGHVYVLDAPWMDQVLSEICAFPMGEEDDFTDTLSGSYEMFATEEPQAEYQAYA